MAHCFHATLDCGAELAVRQLPDRHAESLEIRILAGMVNEPADRLGLAHLVEQTLDKGTERHDGRGLADAFDAIGAGHSSWCGRQASGYTSLCLPEYFDRVVELHAEYLRTPTFPEDACEVAVELSREDLRSLEDDPQALADKLMGRQAYGPILGRHLAGEPETLDAVKQDDFVAFWKKHFHTGRMQIAAAGPLPPEKVAESIERHFAGFGDSAPAGRERIEVEFDASRRHHDKELEQLQIAMGCRAVPKNDPLYAAQRVQLAVLSAGMSSRLFVEVREKQGLVYWIGGWGEYPRGAGLVFIGASSRLEHAEKTYRTTLRELERLREDITEEELVRAKTQIAVSAIMASDRTRSICRELADDLFHYGKPVATEEKIAAVQAVTLNDLKRYQAEVPWQPLSVVTLGPQAINLD